MCSSDLPGRLRSGPGLQASFSGFFWKVAFCPSVLTLNSFYRTASDFCFWASRASNNLKSGFPGAASGIFRKLKSGLRRVLAKPGWLLSGHHSKFSPSRHFLLSELEPVTCQKLVLTHAPLFSSKACVLENIQCRRFF